MVGLGVGLRVGRRARPAPPRTAAAATAWRGPADPSPRGPCRHQSRHHAPCPCPWHAQPPCSLPSGFANPLDPMSPLRLGPTTPRWRLARRRRKRSPKQPAILQGHWRRLHARPAPPGTALYARLPEHVLRRPLLRSVGHPSRYGPTSRSPKWPCARVWHACVCRADPHESRAGPCPRRASPSHG